MAIENKGGTSDSAKCPFSIEDVDLFAPGNDIYTALPNNKHNFKISFTAFGTIKIEKLNTSPPSIKRFSKLLFF